MAVNFGFCDANGSTTTSVAKTNAMNAFAELDSMVGNCTPSLNQFVARLAAVRGDTCPSCHS